MTKNLESIRSMEKIKKCEILKEIVRGWVSGPHMFFFPLRISPLGVVPHKATREFTHSSFVVFLQAL